MKQYLTKEMTGNRNKPGFKIVDERDLEDGVYLRDTDYVDFGEIDKIIIYENSIHVIELETGVRVAVIVDEMDETTYTELGKK